MISTSTAMTVYESPLTRSHCSRMTPSSGPINLDIDAMTEQTRPAQIAVIVRLLHGLWEAGLGAVAVSGFESEEELP
jgi:hypothetical protein